MKMMVLCIIGVGPVALQAELISLLYRFHTVNLMAITAADIVMVHLALHE